MTITATTSPLGQAVARKRFDDAGRHLRQPDLSSVPTFLALFASNRAERRSPARVLLHELGRTCLTLRSLIIGLSLFASAAQALETTRTAPETLKAYAVTLEKSAGSNQWQQLWKRSRESGAFIQQGNQPRFTVSQDKLPDMVRTTLGNATSVQAQATTQALYRYEFAGPIGSVANQSVKALCLLVDWRTLPSTSPTNDPGPMGSVSLLLAQPCT